MPEKKCFTKVLAGVLMAGLLITSGGLALANDSSVKTSAIVKCPAPFAAGDRSGKNGLDLDNLLKKLVADAVITQDQVDKLKTLMEENMESRERLPQQTPGKHQAGRKAGDNFGKGNKGFRGLNQGPEPMMGPGMDILNKAVTAGILTQDQVNAIKEAMQQQMNQQMQERNQAWVDGLIAANIISSDEGKAVIKHMSAMHDQRRAEMAKVQAMTEAERQAYFEKNKDQKKDRKMDQCVSLVEAGLLTKEQADRINTFMHEKAAAQCQEQVKDQLDKLVQAGTITSEQAGAISKYMNDLQQQRQNEMNKIKNMTAEERQQYFEKNRPERPILRR